jgi:hypothetical protein
MFKLHIIVSVSWWDSCWIKMKYNKINLTLYAPCIILQYVYKSTRCTKFLRLYFIFLLDSLRVSDYISPSSEATFYKLYIAFGICQYHTCGCCVAIGRNLVIPKSCITFVQLFLDVLVFIYYFCLLGKNQFDVACIVHHLAICISTKNSQTYPNIPNTM